MNDIYQADTMLNINKLNKVEKYLLKLRYTPDLRSLNKYNMLEQIVQLLEMIDLQRILDGPVQETIVVDFLDETQTYSENIDDLNKKIVTKAHYHFIEYLRTTNKSVFELKFHYDFDEVKNPDETIKFNAEKWYPRIFFFYQEGHNKYYLLTEQLEKNSDELINPKKTVNNKAKHNTDYLGMQVLLVKDALRKKREPFYTHFTTQIDYENNEKETS